MNIIITEEPPVVSLAGNPIVFEITSDNRYSAIGAKSVNELKWTSIDSGGDTFTLEWASISIEFTCVSISSPDESGTQYNGAFSTLSSFVEGVKNVLESNYLVSKDFDVSFDGVDTIILTAKEFGENDIALTVSGANVSITVSTNGSERTERSFYRLLAQLFIDNGVTWEKIGEDLLPLDDQDKANFDFSEYLSSHIVNSFSWPEDGSAFLILQNTHRIQFYIRYAEVFGKELSIKKMLDTISSDNYALGGGVGFMLQSKYNEKAQSFWGNLEYNWQFLTWQPKHKYVYPWQTEKLFFLNYDASYTQLYLVVYVYYTDGNSTFIIKGPIAVLSKYDVIECIVGSDQLGIDSINPSKTISHYEIYLSENYGVTNRVSEKRYFYLKNQYHSNFKEMLFRNSLGGFDTIVFDGLSVKQIEIGRTIINTINNYDFTNVDPESKQESAQEVQTFEVSTGWVLHNDNVNPEELIEWIRELHLSKEVYEILDGILYPVVITNGSAFIKKDDETMYAVELKYARAYTDEHYSKRDWISNVFLESFNASFVST